MTNENKLIIKQLNKYGRVPSIHELMQMIEQLEQENQQLKENYNRIYNENCKLSEEHNINDISLLDENYKLKKEIENLQQENKKQKEVIDNTIEYINKYESIRAYYEYIDEDGYDEYNYDEDFKSKLLDILNEVSE